MKIFYHVSFKENSEGDVLIVEYYSDYKYEHQFIVDISDVEN